jgi:peptide/nickel transport system substrate-binding protein
MARWVEDAMDNESRVQCASFSTGRPDEPRVGRRGFVGGAMALGAAAAFDLSTTGAARAAAESPKSGGTLRLGLGGGGTTDSLSPLAWTDSVMIAAGFGLYNCLVENGPDNRPIPELAERFAPSGSAAKWVLDLRQGVQFHNGKDFDADDAIYSLNLHRGKTTSGAAGSMKAVTGIEKLGKHQIAITLASADADFPSVLTDYHLMMVPNGFTDWAKPIGTGAFRLDGFDPGVRIALRKAGSYWKSGRGYLDAVEIMVVNDTSARMNALISGQVDAVNRVDPRIVARLEKSPKLDIVRAAGGWFAIMAMQVDRAPYTSLDLRQAMKYALEREQMIKTLFNGYGSLGNDHPIPRSDPFFNSELAQLDYDPDKARFHFKKAGIADPKIVLQTSDTAFNGAVDMATLFQASAGKTGIPVEVKKEAADGYFENVWLKGAFVASYWGGRPAATQMLNIAYKSGAPWNETHWNDPKFDQLLAVAQAETDEAKRKSAIWDMQAMLSNASGSLIPCFRDWLDAHAKTVKGHTPHSGYDMDNGRIAEKAWLDA